MTETERPLVTFALFAYNQEEYIREAVQGALAQTYSPLEIIFSDDCSVDGTFQVIQEMAAGYQGPHKLTLNHNEENQGIPRHINAVVKLAGGELIVFGAGDDISDPNRVSTITDEYLKSGRRHVAVYSALMPIDDHSNEIRSDRWRTGDTVDVVKMASHRSGIYGCSAAYSADVFNSFGPIDPDVIQEDMVLPFRAAIAGEILFLPMRLVKYRLHDNNVWNKRSAYYSKAQFLRRMEKYLPSDIGAIRQQIVDLERAQSMSFVICKNAKKVQKILRDRLRRTKFELEVLKAGSRFGAIWPTLQLLFHAVFFKRGVRWFYLRFLPEHERMNQMLLK